MKNRTQRLLEIKKIILTEKISGQDILLKRLKEVGLNYTQATLSRDLKFLKVSKIVDEEHGYIYKLPQTENLELEKNPDENFAFMGFKSLKFSNNFGVIKTKPGYAQSIAVIIDSLNLFEILGTIAGDDTILLIPNEDISRQDIINSLAVSIPALKEKLV